MSHQAIDFKGPCFADASTIAANAFEHPTHAGNSKAQKSLYETSSFPSGDVCSNRQTNGSAVACSVMAMILLSLYRMAARTRNRGWMSRGVDGIMKLLISFCCSILISHEKLIYPEIAHSIISPERWPILQNGIQQRIVDMNLSIVADETQFTKVVHEKANASTVVPIISAKVF
jgi:hypothetical protein